MKPTTPPIFPFCLLITLTTAAATTTLRDLLQATNTRSAATPLLNHHSSPWLTSIEDVSTDPNVRKLLCGASLLSPLHVLTSARCVSRWDGTLSTVPPSHLRVRAGDFDKMKDEMSEQWRMVEGVIVHPGFEFDGGYYDNSLEKKGQFYHDLAILTVTEPFNVTSGGVGNIALGGDDFYGALTHLRHEWEVTLTSYGITSKRQNTIPTSPTLTTVSLPVVKETTSFGLWLNTSSNLLVFNTGIRSPSNTNRGLMGKCIGDLGGPLIINSGPIMGDVLIGVVSFGVWCDRYAPGGLLFVLSPEEIGWVEGVVFGGNYYFAGFFAIVAVAMVFGAICVGVVFLRRRKSSGNSGVWRL